ncbi:MAG: response regulator [Alphaproteobacteria bacterium]|nr:response regulator [Alphaproteobacteria bacterium]MCB9696534.1 response regulator [Alphaproteobacteria bacterium]
MSPHPALDPWLDRVAQMAQVTLDLRPHTPSEMAGDVDRIASATDLLADRMLALVGPDRSDLRPSRVRHDLRTPLNHVLGYGEMLREDLGGTPAEPAVSRLLQLARQVLEGIDDLVETVLSGGTRTPPPPAARDLRPPAVLRDQRSGRILVVDDNEANNDLLRRHLERLGHRVTQADDGEYALELLASAPTGRDSDRPFDLVLLDIVMPGMDGIEVLRAIKRDERWRDLPVLMISSLDELGAVARCIELGAADYLTKPFEPVLLRARVSACLEARRLRDQEVDYLTRIEEERQRAADLLRVILPDPIVDELERTNEVKPRRHDRVAVLFCDIVGFTRYCDAREPEEVLPHLQRLVVAWEQAATTHGLLKIKTIGDGFMAAAGLLQRVDNPVERCVRCAVDLVREVEALQAHAGEEPWSVRIGVHVGPVVAGVLGHRQFQFDLWGDTVNTAARVEQHGTPGGITLSARAWDEIAPTGAVGTPLGAVDAKGKGALELVRFERF